MTMRIFKKRATQLLIPNLAINIKDVAILNREEMRALRFSIKGCENKKMLI